MLREREELTYWEACDCQCSSAGKDSVLLLHSLGRVAMRWRNATPTTAPHSLHRYIHILIFFRCYLFVEGRNGYQTRIIISLDVMRNNNGDNLWNFFP